MRRETEHCQPGASRAEDKGDKDAGVKEAGFRGAIFFHDYFFFCYAGEAINATGQGYTYDFHQSLTLKSEMACLVDALNAQINIKILGL